MRCCCMHREARMACFPSITCVSSSVGMGVIEPGTREPIMGISQNNLCTTQTPDFWPLAQHRGGGVVVAGEDATGTRICSLRQRKNSMQLSVCGGTTVALVGTVTNKTCSTEIRRNLLRMRGRFENRRQSHELPQKSGWARPNEWDDLCPGGR
ncbi:hypothetical protein LZ30DRAFT_483807 [Colletotrichum cereale]|nr:hypothetical protein LZ30DRAFT_483807 [Colletotrichum cereale]